jgi:hypothetical protein
VMQRVECAVDHRHLMAVLRQFMEGENHVGPTPLHDGACRPRVEA